MKERFLTPSQLKKRLSESFPERVPPHMDFHVGYFEGKANAKCWIVSEEDIQAMYDAHFEGDVITIWCDGRGKTEDTSVSRKRKKDADDTDTPLSKREERECQQQKIYDELKKKHSDKKYTDPQLKLWAKLIQSRMHDSYDNPPNIPLITGVNTKKTPNQSTLTGAVVTAANAIASALKPPEAQSQLQQNCTPKSKKQVSSAAVSPCTRASLRRTLYEDLATIQKLHEDCVLSPSEFNEQKQMLLKELRATMPTQPDSSENS